MNTPTTYLVTDRTTGDTATCTATDFADTVRPWYPDYPNPEQLEEKLDLIANAMAGSGNLRAYQAAVFLGLDWEPTEDDDEPVAA